MGRRIIMNACILFILLNGSAWATPGCYNGGYIGDPGLDLIVTGMVIVFLKDNIVGGFVIVGG